jgi:hypothetical protein
MEDVMVRNLLLASTLILAFPVWLTPAAAQPICGDRDELVARLASRYGEVRQDGMPASSSSFYELFGSRETGTWTVLLSGMNGYSCIVRAGRDSRAIDQQASAARDGWPRPGALMVR